MSFIRSAALRASAIARPAKKSFRAAELQPWQRTLQRRTYASAGSHGDAKKSDLPWIVSAVAATGVGLYFVINQDLGGHGDAEHHAEHSEKHAEPEEKEAAPAEEEPKEASKSENKGEEKSEGNAEAPPDKSDEPNPRKEPKSQNETSGKQEGMSNTDTKHTSEISKQDEKSKKGEGVAESAKLKGTVSTERPGAENKEERGKAQQDKSQ
ncbi:hypothetical protein BU26DRAFT_561604 [Trematosphaeria pertusa]|uniref:Cylicin I n=1 Tax=Trematosphaeria pertusa TaxID=390896 RepID=A0A6A6INI0_9PLEO|nr:uncharacterized protein BU26DRAFT_561604 [Trematosphaeria pertusa]KAF2251799.1 hypothetical protein BU26DRAFT_561604 [Trematosphaeria pertusa]